MFWGVAVHDPSAVTTILFTDIEGSTRLWEQDRARMSVTLAGHDAVARAAVESNHGVIVKMTGDGMFAAFVSSADAMNAALALQRALADPKATNGVPLRLRCGLHAGIVERRDDDYFGPSVNRAARIMSAAHGGQVLLSQAVVDRVRELLPATVSLRDLGSVRLKDLATPEHVYQLLHPELRHEFPALRSLEATPNNLPQQVTTFIGRERELSEVKAMLEKNRLLTLLGVGGLGKTRFSLQVGAEVLDDYPDGVWLVELAPLADERLVAQAVASVVGVKEEAGRSVAEALLKFAKDRRLLLILDNCEHLGLACAALAKELLQASAHVKILATSREPLNVGGEMAYQVRPLPVPDPQNRLPISELTQYEAIRLFIDRAVAAQQGFQVTPQNAAAVADICHRLDGIPLAIELAAARVRALAVGQIDARLSDCFRLLTGGDRTALPRQQTLRACIDWSYDLLNDPEKLLLQRLAVFAGGWTLEAAERVCVGESVTDWEILDLSTSLSHKSLVAADQKDDHCRYRLLETVRQYASEKLEKNGGGETVRERHRDYFLALAEEAEPELLGAQQAEWLRCLEGEHENLRAGLNWSLGEAGSRGSLRLCGALQRFWLTRGHLAEGRQWCERVLGKARAEERTPERAKALNGAGVLAYLQGDYPAARALHEASLVIKRLLGDRRGMAASLGNMGNVACEQGDFASARAQYEESLAIMRDLGDRRGLAASLNNLGNVACEEGDFASARTLYEEFLAIMRELGDRTGIARSLNNLGHVAYEQGDFAAARALQDESLTIRQELGNRSGIADSLENLGNVSYEQGDYPAARMLFEEGLALRRELGDRGRIASSLAGLATVIAAFGSSLRAARVWGAAERLREEVVTPLSPKDRPRYDRRVAAARAALGDDAAFDRAWEEGRTLTLEQAMELANERSHERR